MDAATTNADLEMAVLRNEFEQRGLDVEQVWQPMRDDPKRDCWRLRNLLEWVAAREKLGNRKKMQRKGYVFPPIEPGCGPDSDWLRFETWLQGKPVSQKLRDMLKLSTPILPEEQMGDEQIQTALAALVPALYEQRIEPPPPGDIPPRLYYHELFCILDEQIAIRASGVTTHFTGCCNYCPECVRRPWCDNGDSLWSEDEAAGCMVVPEKTKSFVTEEQLDITRLKDLVF